MPAAKDRFTSMNSGSLTALAMIDPLRVMWYPRALATNDADSSTSGPHILALMVFGAGRRFFGATVVVGAVVGVGASVVVGATVVVGVVVVVGATVVVVVVGVVVVVVVGASVVVGATVVVVVVVTGSVGVVVG